MDNAASSSNRGLFYVRWAGAAAILGAVLLILATVIFVLTHGTQMDSVGLFGLELALLILGLLNDNSPGEIQA